MPKTLQLRRDTTSNLASVTGAEGELFVDLTKDTVVVMDGSTTGGFPLAKYTDVTAANVGLKGYTDSAISSNISTVNSTITSANLAMKGYVDSVAGGGGGGVTENADYSKEITIADTYAYVPTSATYSSDGNFGYASLTVDGTTGGTYFDTSDYSSATYDTVDRSITLTASNQLLTDIPSLVGKYIQFGISASDYMSRVTSILDLTGGTYRIVLAANPGGLPQSNGSIGGVIVTGTRGLVTIYSVIGADLLNVLTKLKSEATISIDTLFSVTTTGRFTNTSGTTYEVAVDELFKPTIYSVLPLTIVGNIDAEATWTFALDHTFISDSVLAGNVLISDDIITPLAYNSYGLLDTTAAGTLTVNGNLDVLGTVTNQNKWIELKAHSEDSKAGAIAAGKVLEVGKKYIVNIGTDYGMGTYTVVLPTVADFTGGEEVTVMSNQTSVNIKVFAYEDYPNIDIFYPTVYNTWSVGSSSSGSDVWGLFTPSANGVNMKFVYAPWPNGTLPYRWVMTN